MLLSQSFVVHWFSYRYVLLAKRISKILFLLLFRAVRDNINLLSKAFKNQFVIPEFTYFSQQIKSIYDKCAKNNDGNVASYIPQLAKYDPKLFGLSICTVDGQRYSIGNTSVPFTMQVSL